MKDRIKQIRKNNKMTQSDFGEKLSLSQNYIYMIEKGDREPSDRTIRDICRIWNISESWIRNGTGEMYIQQTLNQEISDFLMDVMDMDDDDFKKQFIASLSRTSDEGWDAIKKFLDTFLEIHGN